MAKEKVKLTDKEMDSKLQELKIELLKQNSKKKAVKKEIARILTFKSLNKIATEKMKINSPVEAKSTVKKK